ncbi:PKD domain protein [bacterium BMS3Abin15]|nr:PKD domain protein [bacterium BMS3Abin15]
MKIKIIILTVLLFFVLSGEGLADISHVVISEVYIDGANDWIELYNPTDNDINLADNDYRIERATASGGNPSVLLIYGKTSHNAEYPGDTTILSRGFYLHVRNKAKKQLKNRADALSDFTLTNNNVIYLATGSVGSPEKNHNNDKDIIDYVGYGKAFQYEGNDPAPNPTSSESIIRKDNAGVYQDTDNNKNDFILSSPDPQNSSGDNNDDNDDDNENDDKKYSKDIRINELFPNPKKSPEKKYEFIELYNYGDEYINLDGWLIEDKARRNKNPVKLSGTINPDDYIVFYSKIALNNSNEGVWLRDPNEDEIDYIAYSTTQEGYSYSFDGNSFLWTRYKTPGAENKFDEKKEYTNKIYLNEILPNPSGEEGEGEYIEIYNPTGENIGLANWTLRDASSTGKYVLPENTIVESKKYLVIYRKNFKFALNNSGEEKVYLIDPNGKTVSLATYSGSDEDASYNFNGKKWRWSRFLTPGEKNKFNNLPQVKIKIDKNVYKNVYADFEVKASDLDKDELKFVWDFGDNHRSYKQGTRHKYLKTGNYKASIKVSDGSEEVIGKFKVEVKKFPHQDIKIVGLSPNPSGKDSDFEWIDIKNESDGKVNLKSWSVATGWKILYNHPIYEKLIIEAGEIERLTRDMCRFTLNNKRAKIELRYPDGEVAYDLEYDKKDESVKDDEIYEEIDGKWKWTTAQNNAEPTLANAENTGDTKDTEEEIIKILDEFLGKQSLDPDKKDFKILLISFMGNIGLLDSIINNQEIVSGALAVKHDGLTYVFTRNNYLEEHYVIKFLKSLGFKINSLVNKIILIFI